MNDYKDILGYIVKNGRLWEWWNYRKFGLYIWFESNYTF